MSIKRKCCIVDCEGSDRLYRFPNKETDQYKSWMNHIAPVSKKISKIKSPLVCSKHFASKWFGKKKKRLLKDAIPTIFGKTNEIVPCQEVVKGNCIHQIPTKCTKCDTNSLLVKHQGKLIDELNNKIAGLTENRNFFKKELRKFMTQTYKLELRNQAISAKQKLTLEDRIKALHVSPATQTLIQILLKSSKAGYSDKEKALLQQIFNFSLTYYKFLRKIGIDLPHVTSVYRWQATLENGNDLSEIENLSGDEHVIEEYLQNNKDKQHITRHKKMPKKVPKNCTAIANQNQNKNQNESVDKAVSVPTEKVETAQEPEEVYETEFVNIFGEQYKIEFEIDDEIETVEFNEEEEVINT